MSVREEDNNISCSSNNELYPHQYMAVHTHTCNHQWGKEMCKLVNALHLLKILMPLCWFSLYLVRSLVRYQSIVSFFSSYICFLKWCMHLYCIFWCFGVACSNLDVYMSAGERARENTFSHHVLEEYECMNCLYFHFHFKWFAWVFFSSVFQTLHQIFHIW